jgi:anti-sigma factor RsiW
MKHLTDTQLNEYLDGALDSSAQIRMAAHLSSCGDCQTRLASLQTVFQALAALPEETIRHDLTPSVLQSLPRNRTGLAWRLAFAVQAGISLGLLLLFAPIVTDRLARIVGGLASRFTSLELKFPAPVDLHFSLPVVRLPLPAIPTLPIAITHDNSAIWLTLGIAAVLLFTVGNFSLIFHSTSEVKK